MDAFEGVVGELEYPMFIVTARAADGEPLGCLVGFTTQASIDPPRFIACLSHATAPTARTRRARARRARRARRRRRPRRAVRRRDRATRSTSSRAATGTRGRRACRSSTAARTGSRAACSARFDAGDHDAFLLEPLAGGSGDAGRVHVSPRQADRSRSRGLRHRQPSDHDVRRGRGRGRSVATDGGPRGGVVDPCTRRRPGRRAHD